MGSLAARSGRWSPFRLGGLAIAAATAALACAGPAAPSAEAQETADRYSLAGGCYALESESLGTFVVRDGGSYRAATADMGEAERFRMQATTLGRYLFYDSSQRFLGVTGGVPSATAPSNATDLTVDGGAGTFTIVNGFNNRQLSVAGDDLATVAAGSAGDGGRFSFHPADGCATYPEVEVNATGEPARGTPSFGEVSGFFEGHMHQMAFEFLGGKAHCGKPWHRFGAPYALVDCDDHEVANGCAAILENVLYGSPVRCHDHTGWPTFSDWPDHQSLTHEQSYYKWLERAWRGGLRLYVNLMVENRVLCELYPYKQNDCDEMASVLKQIGRIHELQDYIDAQSGGPGEGWFRIVTHPFEARRAINDGKLAVVLGMEVSEPFGCRRWLGSPTCTPGHIDNWLDRLHELGIRQLELTNKFDNGLTGVAGDSGEIGLVTNSGNFLSTGSFWNYAHCPDAENSDRTPIGVEVPHNHDLIIGLGLERLLPPLGGALPIYPAAPHCNRLGLTALGEHALKGVIERRMIFDPDHMSVKARNESLDLLEEVGYPGVMSSHSWSTPDALPRILRLGGVVSPSTSTAPGFAEKWDRVRRSYEGDQYFGIGFGADMNGFASQPGARTPGETGPLEYPFRSFDGSVELDRNVSGERVWDINVDGVAHYGLYPDWVEDLRLVAGEELVDDLGRGAEAYLQMWERTEGVGPVDCGAWRDRNLNRRGLGGRLRLGDDPATALDRAGQPADRERTWRWCAGSDRDDVERRVSAGFVAGPEIGVVASTLRRHRAGGLRPGMPRQRLRRRAERLGGGLWVRDAGPNVFVYQLGGGRIHQIAVATPGAASKPALLRRHLNAP